MSFRPSADPLQQYRVDPRLTEPTIWVQRLVIVESWTADAEPVLDVEFRRGLNIIATALPGKGERDRVGHNVGKTLLTRFLRYCLGEPHFARKSVREAIQREFPEGFVLAQIIVAGESWVVARPLALEPRVASRSWQSSSWRSAVESTDAEPFSRFLDRVTEVTAARCAEVILPGRRRRMSWLDMLAWISRDQHCAYRDPLEWRSTWSDSGAAALDIEDASLVVRLAMDLVNNEEGRLIDERKALLQKKAEAAEEHSQKVARLTRTREMVMQRLSATDELLEGDLFADAAKRSIEAEIEELGKRVDDLPVVSGLTAAQAELAEARQSLRDTENGLIWRENELKTAEAQIKQHQTADGASDSGFADLFGCPLERHDCSRHLELEVDQERRDYRQELTEHLEGRQKALVEQIASMKREGTTLGRKVARLETAVAALAAKTATQVGPVARRITLLETLLQEVTDFDIESTTCQRLERRVAKLEREVEQLRQRQREVAGQNSKKLRQLNQSIRYVLQYVLGKDADEVIRIGTNRLTFATDDDASSPGEGMATSATVSLDLACLRASLAGLGHLPRLVIHDSPRGGDLEQHLYARLFDFIVELESACEDPPPFQYIMATTTQPPEELLAEPYLRLTLDARRPEGLLLKRRF